MMLRTLVFSLFFLSLGAMAHAQETASDTPYRDYAIGSDTAPLEIIEYASFACPHCGHFHTAVWPMLHNEFIETGQVRFIIRPILTQPLQIAGASAILASCAGEDRYYDAVDLLFVEQENIFAAIRAQQDLLPIYNRVGAAVGVSPEAFMACLQAPEHSQRIEQTLELAAQDVVSGTPSFLIRGEILKIEQVDGALAPTWGGNPVIINGERLSGDFTEDSFRRIVLHFLNESDSDAE